jgi:hypothetical protein
MNSLSELRDRALIAAMLYACAGAALITIMMVQADG